MAEAVMVHMYLNYFLTLEKLQASCNIFLLGKILHATFPALTTRAGFNHSRRHALRTALHRTSLRHPSPDTQCSSTTISQSAWCVTFAALHSGPAATSSRHSRHSKCFVYAAWSCVTRCDHSSCVECMQSMLCPRLSRLKRLKSIRRRRTAFTRTRAVALHLLHLQTARVHSYRVGRVV